jgi:hypothetical protein
MDPTGTTSGIGQGIIDPHGKIKDRMGSFIPMIHKSFGKENWPATHMHIPDRVHSQL